MTRLEMRNMIKLRMGNNNDTSLNALIEAELNLQKNNLEEEPEQHWFQFGYAAVNGISSNVIPFTFKGEGNLLMVHPDAVLQVRKASTTDTWKMLVRDDDSFLYDKYGELASTDLATAYAFTGVTVAAQAEVGTVSFTVYPKPAFSCDYRVLGYKGTKDLAADEDTNAWSIFAPELLLSRVGKIIAGQYGALNLYQAPFEKTEIEAKDKLRRKDIAFEEEQIVRVRGE